MNKKLLILSAFCLAALPSCMHPVEQVLNASADAKQAALIERGTIAQGACDDIGQYAARANATDRVSMQSAPVVVSMAEIR